MRYLLLILLGWFHSQYLISAPCCGNSSTGVGVLVDDQRLQFSVATSFSERYADARGDGNYQPYRSDVSDWMNRNELTFNYQTSSPLQVGLSVPFQYRRVSFGNDSKGGMALGDINLWVGSEVFPVNDYQAFRPRVFFIAQMGFPSGKSRFESLSSFKEDVTGQGFWASGPGLFLVKNVGRVTFSSLFRVQFFLASQGRTKAPTWSSSFKLIYQPFKKTQARILTELFYEHEGEVQDRLLGNFRGSRTLSLIPAVQWQVSDTLSLHFSYSDEGWFPGNINKPLAQSFSFSLSFQELI